MLSISEILYQEAVSEGEARGEVRGEARGEAKGRVATLIRQLERRFGPLSPDMVSRIEGASPEELDTWTDQVLDASSLEEMFGNVSEC